MKRAQLILFFLIINMGSLAIGSWLMNNGPKTDWYINLNKAPWSPPGWLFGIAWTTIMVCFSVLLAHLFSKKVSKKIKIAFTLQVFLNIIWNFIFFNQHLILLGLINIILLTIVIYYLFFKIKISAPKYRFLLLPYMIWSVLATSLNSYILIYN
jgi:tryptophan-rich sensory protein